MPLTKLNLRPKVTIVVMCVVLIAMTGAVLVAYRSMRDAIIRENQRSADSVAGGLAAAAEVPLAVGDREELRRLAGFSLKANGLTHVRFIGHGGGDIVRLDDLASPDAGAADQIVGSAEVRVTTHDANDLDIFDEAPGRSQPSTEKKRIATVEVGMQTSAVRERLEALQRAFARIVAAAGLVIGTVLWLLAGAWTRRLDRLVDASQRMARGELEFPLDDARHDEIGRLTGAFESMRVAVRDRDEAARRFSETLQEQVRVRTHDLEEAMLAAQAANRAKSDFLANMSHEIRTPMTAILGFAELLNDPEQPPDARRENVETINRSGQHLLSVINDILDLSKIEAGRMTVEPVPCSPVSIIEDVISLMRVRASEKGLELDVVYGSAMPRTIRSDPGRLRQILINLVGNAVKFTQQGRVAIHARVDAASERMIVGVEDTGIGIAPESLGMLFRPFSQSDSSMSRRFGGTGLGLAIGKRFAELLGGSLSVRSTPGQGSEFTLEVQTGPLGACELITGQVVEQEAACAPAAPSPTLEGVRVLLAEDGVDNQRLIAHHLRKSGATVEIAENGRLACDAAAAAKAGGRPFDLILMDMQMPEMDGYAAATALRTRGDRTPIVALTAHALVGDRDKCMAAGCTDYLTKPVNRTDLIARCRKWATEGNAGRRRAA
ncbi:two-component system, sensor histidine kinase [Phycisphaerales bacterium]|nr:two-component system, sensor histidine kinase [Phycisphaerales bacterium]